MAGGDRPGAVIVTGATYGIGRGIVLDLARRGWPVVGLGLDGRQVGSAAEGGIAGTLDALEAEDLIAEIIEADVSDAAQVAAAVKRAASAHGRVHGLVNNAAIRPTGTILDTDEATFERTLAVNLKGQFLTCRAVIPLMKKAGGGSIVNVGSGAGYGKPGILAYSASKGGVFALSAALAHDHRADGIRVNMVVPGPQTASGMVEEMSAVGDPPPPGTVSGRQTAPRDVANAVAFLLSDEAEQMSGAVIDVGGVAGQAGVEL